MLKFLNTLVLVAMYIMSYLASATSVLGPQTINLANAFPFTFMPPGIIFSLAWTTIYILLGWFIISMRGKSFSEKTHKKTLWLLLVINLLNIARLRATAQSMFIVAVIIMVLMTILLGMIMDIIYKHGMQKHIIRACTGAYYGWVSTATVALGFSQLMYIYNPDFMMSDTWMYIAVGSAISISICSWRRRKNIYSVVFSLMGIGGAVWARFIGR